MKMTKTLVVGVDGSPTSAAALRWAMRHAQATGSAVVAVTAWSYIPALDPRKAEQTALEVDVACRRGLEAFVESARLPGVDIRAEVHEGDPAEVLLAAARDADLLVLGRHGHGRVLRALVGSVSAKCLRAATCPVVILPAQVGEAEGKAGEAAAALGYEPGPIV